MHYQPNNYQKTLWRYYLASFFMSLHFFGAVIVPFFTDWGGLTKLQMLILQSWFMFWVFVFEIPTGAIADYFGRKYSLVLGALIVTFGAILYGSIPSFPIFLLSEFMFAFAFACQSGADEALLYDTLKQAGKESESNRVFGRSEGFNLLGMLVAAPFGSLIAARFGLNYPMLATSVPFLMGALLLWTIKEPQRLNQTSESKRFLDIVKNGFRYLSHHRVLRLLAADAILVSVAAYYVIWFYQSLLAKVGLPILYFGYFHVLLVGSEILISTNFVRLEQWFRSKKAYLRFSAIATSLTFLLVALYTHLTTILLFLFFAGGVGLTRLKLMNSYMNKFIPSAQRATVLSSISMFRRLSLAFLNLLVGFLADRSLTLTLFVIGLLPLMVFFFSPIEQSMLTDHQSEKMYNQ